MPGLKLAYQGFKSYLNPQQRQQIIDWLKQKDYWDLNELECYVAQQFDVTFAAKSSYYELFHAAGISWKKSQGRNPRRDPELVEQKKQS